MPAVDRRLTKMGLRLAEMLSGVFDPAEEQ